MAITENEQLLAQAIIKLLRSNLALHTAISSVVSASDREALEQLRKALVTANEAVELVGRIIPGER